MLSNHGLLNNFNSLFLILPNKRLLSALFATFIASRIVKLMNGLRAVNYLSGYRVPFQPLASPGAILPTMWWNPGVRSLWLWRKALYKTGETFSIVPFLVGAPSIYTSNLDVMKQVCTGDRRADWHKSEDTIVSFSKWGANLVGTQNGETWRRHRRIVGPAFNNNLYQTVWSETLKVYRDMVTAEGWSTEATINVPKLSTKMALLVIAKCGFGFSVDWTAPPVGKDGKITIQETLRVLADSYIVSMMLPSWVRYLPLPGFSKIRTAMNVFTDFMAREVLIRTEEVQSGSEFADQRVDIFTTLVKANEQETEKLKLSDQEVIGNVFVMLFAGHETIAHAISAALALLALHQDIQKEIWEHIVEVVGCHEPTYNDYDRLDKVLATFYEALRMFPPAYMLIREAAEDIILNIPDSAGEEGLNTPLTVHKDHMVVIDIIGISYNPRYFTDPEEFRPSRWYATSSEPEALSAFSIGPRACIGRKFATVEAVAFLTMFLRDWHISPSFETGETPAAWRERVLSKPTIGLTLGITSAPVKLTRRKARK